MPRSVTKQLTFTLDDLIELPGRDYLEEIVFEDLEWDQGVEDIDFIDYKVISSDSEDNSVVIEAEVYFFDTKREMDEDEEEEEEEDLEDSQDSYEDD